MRPRGRVGNRVGCRRRFGVSSCASPTAGERRTGAKAPQDDGPSDGPMPPAATDGIISSSRSDLVSLRDILEGRNTYEEKGATRLYPNYSCSVGRHDDGGRVLRLRR